MSQKLKVMVKAHSLLYAIYICLLISIVCGGLLYYGNIYQLLNLHYTTSEKLYTKNESLVNELLGNELQSISTEENPDGIQKQYQIKNHGLLTVLTTKTYIKNDTVTAHHFIGNSSPITDALYVANFSKPVSYTGTVSIQGNSYLPLLDLEPTYVLNQAMNLKHSGKKMKSDLFLPQLNKKYNDLLEEARKVSENDSNAIKQNDSLSFNSFGNPSAIINLNTNTITKNYKGNIIIKHTDSLFIPKNIHLEDIIIVAPKVTIEKGFSGSLQVVATQSIVVGENIHLQYPSSICINNSNSNKSELIIGKNCKVQGAIVMFGNSIENLSNHIIQIDEGGSIVGQIYCSGKLDLKSNIYGSVYTNRFTLKTSSATYDNTISNIEINCNKLPKSFIAFPLFENNTQNYGQLKKVL